jgi:hypothetical protein
MAAIKLHVFAGHDDGSTECDFRKEKRIGKAQGDEHRTVLEIDPATDAQVALAMLHGPDLNAAEDAMLKFFAALVGDDEKFKELLKKSAAALHKALGGDGSATTCGLRIGVWDD